MPDINPKHFQLIAEDLQKQIDELKKSNTALEEEVSQLSTAIAMIAEMWRRMDHELQTGEPPEFCQVGRYSFIMDSDKPNKIPIKLALTRLDDKCLRIDFLEDSGDNDREHN